MQKAEDQKRDRQKKEKHGARKGKQIANRETLLFHGFQIVVPGGRKVRQSGGQGHLVR